MPQRSFHSCREIATTTAGQRPNTVLLGETRTGRQVALRHSDSARMHSRRCKRSFTPSSTSSTGSKARPAPVARAGSLAISPAWTSSCSTNSAICPSLKPVASFIYASCHRAIHPAGVPPVAERLPCPTTLERIDPSANNPTDLAIGCAYSRIRTLQRPAQSTETCGAYLDRSALRAQARPQVKQMRLLSKQKMRWSCALLHLALGRASLRAKSANSNVRSADLQLRPEANRSPQRAAIVFTLM